MWLYPTTQLQLASHGSLWLPLLPLPLTSLGLLDYFCMCVCVLGGLTPQSCWSLVFLLPLILANTFISSPFIKLSLITMLESTIFLARTLADKGSDDRVASVYPLSVAPTNVWLTVGAQQTLAEAGNKAKYEHQYLN